MVNFTQDQLIPKADGLVDPVPEDVKELFQLIVLVIVCGVLSLFGTFSNIANIAVFARQGFKDSINISLMGLAVADLVCSFSMFCLGLFYNPLFRSLNLPIEYVKVACVTAASPHVCFNRITSSITAFITLERCLCIAMPLKVKTIITPLRTKVIIVSIFISTILIFCPFYFVNKLDWKFSPERNMSIISLSGRKGREVVEAISFFTHSVFMSSALLICVIVCTITLVVKLNEKTKWRQTSQAQTTLKPETTSVKDQKVVKMITLIASIFIACYLPTTVIFIVMVFFPEFSILGQMQNFFLVVWSVAFVLETVNSSVNILVYYKMSSKFKATLCEIFCRQPTKK